MIAMIAEISFFMSFFLSCKRYLCGVLSAAHAFAAKEKAYFILLSRLRLSKIPITSDVSMRPPPQSI